MANATTITGNLTREPEIRYTKEGQATAQLGIAVNRRWQDRTTQEWQEADVVLRRHLLEGPGGERGPEPLQGNAGRRHRPAGAAQLGDRGGRAPFQGGDHGRRDRAEPALRHRRHPAGGAPECRRRGQRRGDLHLKGPEGSECPTPPGFPPQGTASRTSHCSTRPRRAPVLSVRLPIGTPPGALWPSAPGGVPRDADDMTSVGTRGRMPSPPADSEPQPHSTTIVCPVADRGAGQLGSSVGESSIRYRLSDARARENRVILRPPNLSGIPDFGGGPTELRIASVPATCPWPLPVGRRASGTEQQTGRFCRPQIMRGVQHPSPGSWLVVFGSCAARPGVKAADNLWRRVRCAH